MTHTALLHSLLKVTSVRLPTQGAGFVSLRSQPGHVRQTLVTDWVFKPGQHHPGFLLSYRDTSTPSRTQPRLISLYVTDLLSKTTKQQTEGKTFRQQNDSHWLSCESSHSGGTDPQHLRGGPWDAGKRREVQACHGGRPRACVCCANRWTKGQTGGTGMRSQSRDVLIALQQFHTDYPHSSHLGRVAATEGPEAEVRGSRRVSQGPGAHTRGCRRAGGPAH